MDALREDIAEEKNSAENVERIRKPGGGRKAQKDKDVQLLADLDQLLDPVTRGDPMAPLCWTAKSTTKLAKELQAKGHAVSQATVWRLLDGLGYSMQSNCSATTIMAGFECSFGLGLFCLLASTKAFATDFHDGRVVYSHAQELLITADGGGSNGSRVRLWKREIQRLADDLAMTIHVRHFPPGTSKWNKIEHRMFCHITENWRARPLTSLMTIINLIGNTHKRRSFSPVRIG